MVRSVSHGEGMKRRVAILISGRGLNMTALIEAATAGFPAEIVVVISNRADAGGLERPGPAASRVIIESKPFGGIARRSSGSVVRSGPAQGRPDLSGGFMRLFTAEFVRSWYGRSASIHPSLLPSFPGLDPHAQALRAGVKVSGATVHFVIPETDAGPIVMQGAVRYAMTIRRRRWRRASLRSNTGFTRLRFGWSPAAWSGWRAISAR